MLLALNYGITYIKVFCSSSYALVRYIHSDKIYLKTYLFPKV